MKRARGRALELLGIDLAGIERKHYWWIFREWDCSLRKRIMDFLRALR